MKIYKKKLLAISNVALLLVIAIGFLFANLKFDDFYSISKFLSIYTIINLILLEIILLKYEKRINFYELFIVLCFLFLFGQCYAITFFKTLGEKSLFNITSSFFNTRLLYKTSFFVLICIFCMSIGYLIAINNYNIFNKEKHSNKNPSMIDRKSITKIGWILLIVSILPTMYLCYKDIVALKTYGYAITISAPTGIDKILNIFKGIFQSSLLILIISEQGKRKKTSYMILIVYLLEEMIGGTRIQTFRFLIILLLLYFEKHKITLKNIGLGILITIIASIIFSFISASRTTAISMESFGNFISLLNKNNVLYDILIECGHTQTLLMVVFLKCPSIVDFQYGFSFIRALLSAIPNLGFWNIHPAMKTVDTVFSPLYTDKIGLGGSIFAVMYWNFGFFIGPIAMCFFGAIIAKLTNKINNSSDLIEKFLSYYLLFYFSFLVRGDIEQFGRDLVYYCIFPIFLMKIYNNFEKNKGINYENSM